MQAYQTRDFGAHPAPVDLVEDFVKAVEEDEGPAI